VSTRPAFALKIAYDLGELARMAGLSRKATRTLLRKEGVAIRCPGERHKAYVYLTDLQQLPNLWGAILTKLGLEAAYRSAKIAPDEDF
jgi:hypothetical protein